MSERAKNFSPAPIGEPAPAVPSCANGQTYTVKSGDTMFFIAKRFNVSLQNLIDANPQITDPNLIFPGQVLCIPSPIPGAFCPNGQIYRVVSGDTIYQIAKSFGITMDALLAANPQIADPNLIFPGQEICVPAVTAPVAPPPAPACPMGTLYTVQPGDTMFDIAQANNVLLDALIAANPQISDPNLIFPGQVICIPEAAAPEAPLPEPTPPPAPLPAPRPMPCGPGMCPMPCGPGMCPMPVMPAPAPMPMPMPMPMPVMPAPAPMPCAPGRCPMPSMPAPAPMPMPMPSMPAPAPMPMPMMPMPMPKPAPSKKRRPAPMPPVVSPIQIQPQPMPAPPMPAPLPCQMPAPMPIPMPYPGEEMGAMPMMCQPMPVYVAVPWNECPFHNKKRKHHRKRCR